MIFLNIDEYLDEGEMSQKSFLHDVYYHLAVKNENFYLKVASDLWDHGTEQISFIFYKWSILYFHCNLTWYYP